MNNDNNFSRSFSFFSFLYFFIFVIDLPLKISKVQIPESHPLHRYPHSPDPESNPQQRYLWRRPGDGAWLELQWPPRLEQDRKEGLHDEAVNIYFGRGSVDSWAAVGEVIWGWIQQQQQCLWYGARSQWAGWADATTATTPWQLPRSSTTPHHAIRYIALRYITSHHMLSYHIASAHVVALVYFTKIFSINF